jgi:hypothetical protein
MYFRFFLMMLEFEQQERIRYISLCLTSFDRLQYLVHTAQKIKILNLFEMYVFVFLYPLDLVFLRSSISIYNIKKCEDMDHLIYLVCNFFNLIAKMSDHFT